MKKLLWIVSVLLAVALLASFVGPYLVLKAARQPEVAESYAYSDAFCTTYEQTRQRFQQRIATLQAAGEEVQADSFADATAAFTEAMNTIAVEIV